MSGGGILSCSRCQCHILATAAALPAVGESPLGGRLPASRCRCRRESCQHRPTTDNSAMPRPGSRMSQLLLTLHRLLYERLARPLIFRGTAHTAHESLLRLLAELDGNALAIHLLKQIGRSAKPPRGMAVQQPDPSAPLPLFPSAVTSSPPAYKSDLGGLAVQNPVPAPPLQPSSARERGLGGEVLILAAGMVKGRGFPDEATALRAVDSGENIIPGWRSVPALVGLVEFGSFTRWPRLGNPGTVIWRDEPTRSTQNRVGLKNPGARAAAAFLARHAADLPPVYGLNIAVSPGVTDPAQELDEVLTSLSFFLEQNLTPAWFTLNLSCPNTEDDPGGHQTAARARDLCGAIIDHLVGTRFIASAPSIHPIPLWIKISPELGADQYTALMQVCAEVGVQAIIATNTLPRPTPDNPGVNAGVGGGRLHQPALEAVRHLAAARAQSGCNVKLIGCGGVLDGATARALLDAGADALQYWSALIYRGPLAAAQIQQEIELNG